MAYVVNKLGKVAPARKQVEDGEYTVIISRFEEPKDKNPYFVFKIVNDGRELRYFLNSDASVEILESNINAQLELDVDDDAVFETWKDAVLGKEITVWVLSSEGTDANGNPTVYHNVTPYKPAMFDAVINGLI